MFHFFTKKNKFTNTVWFFVFFIFVFVNIFLLPSATLGQVGGPVTIAEDIPRVRAEVKTSLGNTLYASALGALVQGASYFARKVAYDLAVAVATAGKGQTPLIFTDPFGAYLTDVADGAVGTALEQLGTPFGLNLCQTPDVKVGLFIQVGLRSIYDLENASGNGKSGPQPSCTFSQFRNAWSKDAFEQKYGSNAREVMGEVFSAGFSTEETDLGIALGAMAKVDRLKAQAVEGAKATREEGGGYKGITSLISGDIKTPSDVIREETKRLTTKEKTGLDMNQISGVYGAGAKEILPMAAKVFLNTLTSKLLDRVMTGLFDTSSGGEGGSTAWDSLDNFKLSKQQAQEIFSELLVSKVVQNDTYNLIATFSNCPESPLIPGIYNCVIEEGLRDVLTYAKNNNEPVTIRKAMDENWLHKNWYFAAPSRAENYDISPNSKCLNGAYCYSNIKKLVRTRILPIGFEVAALNADPDQPEIKWTLENVVNGFDDCNYVNGEIVPDLQGHPFCRLIDPNWLIKAPEVKCNAMVYTNNLSDKNVALRQTECVDIATCLSEDPNTGECDFGHCTREKNIWKFNSNVCEAENATCKTFVNTDSGAKYSYLSRTLDYGACSADNVGCRAFSQEKNVSDEWVNSNDVDADWSLKRIGRNQVLYFNSSVEMCSDADNGCNAFYSAVFDASTNSYLNSYEKDNLVYLKKAPDYLGCYDTEESTPEVIDWPETITEIGAIPQSEQCKNFSQVCLEEEVGCRLYEPMSNPNLTAIPGIIGENSCDRTCEGYQTYRQEASSFETTKYPTYFIPDNAQSCQPEDKGCDEFTNLEVQTGGGEKIERYKELRYCERPTADNEGTFYSWQGSETEGYVLKVHNLLKVDTNDSIYLQEIESNLNFLVNTSFPVGSPVYSVDSVDNLNKYYNDCNETNYNNLINNQVNPANEDCRALYDREGKIFYRLLTNVALVSPNCHPLRKTDTNLYSDENISTSSTCANKGGQWVDVASDNISDEVCQRCAGGGVYQNGSCIYWAMTGVGQSQTCSAAAVGCREYTGNNASNVRIILSADFEPTSDGANGMTGALSGWSGVPGSSVSISSEALQLGLHSLKSTGTRVINIVTSTLLAKDDFYELSFWARGKTQKLDIFFEQGITEVGKFTFNNLTNNQAMVDIGDTWQKYKLGPIQFTGTEGTNAKLVFENHAGAGVVGQYYLDKVELTRVIDSIYKIKNSWQTPVEYPADGGRMVMADVPLLCDANPLDIYPGAALGCEAYKNSDENKVEFLTGFESLCRPEAVGCSALYDTYNTPNISGAVAYNVKCQLPNQIFATQVCYLPNSLGNCSVLPGTDHCYVDMVNLPGGYSLPAANISTSTIMIPADTPSDSPIFLTNYKDYRCTSAKNIGCSYFGAEVRSLPGENDNKFSFMEGWYINDPALYLAQGTKRGILCRDDLVGCQEYTEGSNKHYFRDPVLTGNQLCKYDPAHSPNAGWYLEGVGKCSNSPATNVIYCSKDNDCDSGSTCIEQGSQPCYSSYYLNDGTFGIYSNGTEQYKGMVGICPSTESGCTEFVDPSDNTEYAYPLGKPYYVINNDKLTGRAAEDCGGKVSQKEGCILFNKTDDPKIQFDSAATYKKSENNIPKFGKVDPERVGDLDTNIILKVDRDRECAEWLSCRGSLPVPDENSTNGFRNACYALQLCDQGSSDNCTHQVDVVTNPYLDEKLTYDNYVKRDVSWTKGKEFSGYSIYNQYSPGVFDFVSFTVTGTEKIVYVGAALKDTECAGVGGEITPCGENGKGVCQSGKCVMSVRNNQVALTDTDTNKAKNLFIQECRGYPEETSPFDPKFIITDSQNNTRVKDFEKAELCEEGEDCDCNYTKVKFDASGLDVKYYSLHSQNDVMKKNGLCEGGVNNGKACVSADDCGELGTCKTVVSKDPRIGWSGFCLDRDLSHRVNGRTGNSDEDFACLTWLPLDYIPATFDIYYNDPKSGYVAPAGAGSPGQYYCTKAAGMADLAFGSFEFEGLNSLNTWYLPVGDKDAYEDYLDNTPEEYFPTYNVTSNANQYDDDTALVVTSSYQCSGCIGTTTLKNLWFKGKYFQNFVHTVLGSLQPSIDKFNSPSYEYVSRVDIDRGIKSTSANSINEINFALNQEGEISNIFTLEQINMIKQLLFLGRLSMEKGYECSTPACLSRYEVSGVLLPRPTSARTKSFDEVVNGTAVVSSTPVIADDDTGIVRHYPTRYEEFLNKNFLNGVSWIPLWPDGGDTTLGENPVFGYSHSIDFSADYPKVGDSDGNIVMHRSTYDNGCAFCSWWVLKTDYPSMSVIEGPPYKSTTNNRAVEGYLLQWWGEDPVSGDYAKNEYMNSNSYAINPLLSDGGEPEVTCSSGNDPSTNWLAIEYLFDKETGEFLGYRSRWCENSSYSHGIASAISWSVRPFCSEATQVYDSINVTETTNKAFTDRVWNGYTARIGSSLKYTYDLPASPFGSGRDSGGQTTQAGSTNPWFFMTDDAKSVNAGYAYGCDTTPFSGLKGTCSLAPYDLGGTNVAIPQANSSLVTIPDSNGWDELKKLFAKSFNVRIFNSNSTGTVSWVETTAFDVSNTGKPPRIFPVQDSCVGRSCQADVSDLAGGFSVNQISIQGPDQRLFGRGFLLAKAQFYTWADYNQSPIRRIMVDWRESGNTGNGTIAGQSRGFYKNYKPYCGSGVKRCMPNDPQNDDRDFSGITCEENSDCPDDSVCMNDGQDYFGNQPVACEDTYVVRTFNYTCDADTYNGKYTSHSSNGGAPDYVYKVKEIDDADKFTWLDNFAKSRWYEFLTKTKGLTDDELICVYQPRVQVLDNWGWCNGSCATNYTSLGQINQSNPVEKNGCYNDLVVTITGPNGSIYKQTKPQCELSNIDYINQWFNYNNIVVVAP
ncbi:MAG: hypothetical protein WA057_03580 [Candidatus Magasanikiibacteriota bacterium]